MNKTYEGFLDDKKQLESKILELISGFEKHYGLRVSYVGLIQCQDISERIGRTRAVKLDLEV